VGVVARRRYAKLRRDTRRFAGLQQRSSQANLLTCGSYLANKDSGVHSDDANSSGHSWRFRRWRRGEVGDRPETTTGIPRESFPSATTLGTPITLQPAIRTLPSSQRCNAIRDRSTGNRYRLRPPACRYHGRGARCAFHYLGRQERPPRGQRGSSRAKTPGAGHCSSTRYGKHPAGGASESFS